MSDCWPFHTRLWTAQNFVVLSVVVPYIHREATIVGSCGTQVRTHTATTTTKISLPCAWHRDRGRSCGCDDSGPTSRRPVRAEPVARTGTTFWGFLRRSTIYDIQDSSRIFGWRRSAEEGMFVFVCLFFGGWWVLDGRFRVRSSRVQCPAEYGRCVRGRRKI